MLTSFFIATFLISFLGALPFGIVNLSVTKITIQENKLEAFKFAFGASLIELLHALLALFFAEMILKYLIENPIFKFAVGFILISVGIFLFFRNENPNLENKAKSERSLPKFLLGTFLSFINPQAIPFWIVSITYLTTNSYTIVSISEISIFFIAILIGKNLALSLFVYGSKLISTKIKLCCNIISKAMGTILIVGGLVHYIKVYL